MIRFLLLILSIACTSCVVTEEQVDSSEAEPCLRKDKVNTLRVSLVELIVNSEDFDNKCVMVLGKLDALYKSSGLFMNNDDREWGVTINSIRIYISEEQEESLKKYNGTNYVVVGRFKAFKRNKHIYRGAITNITSIEPDF